MRAVVCTAPTGIDDLILTEVDEPVLRPTGVRIAIEVAAVNPPDGLMAAGGYQVRPDPPFVLGIEGAGIVTEVGALVDRFAVGDRVMTYAGIGCMAEHVVADQHLVHRIPDEMGFDEAAGFTLGYGTVHHGLVDRGHLTPDDTVVVLGAAGGLGVCAIQVAKALGARVIAVARTPEKRAACLELGADVAVSSEGDELRQGILAATGGMGATVVHDTVGGEQTMAALRSLAPLGRHLIVGYASGRVPEIPAHFILLKQVAVIGVSYRQHVQQRSTAALASMEELLGLWTSGALRPRVHATFAMEDHVEAIKSLGLRDVVGKVNIRVGT